MKTLMLAALLAGPAAAQTTSVAPPSAPAPLCGPVLENGRMVDHPEGCAEKARPVLPAPGAPASSGDPALARVRLISALLPGAPEAVGFDGAAERSPLVDPTVSVLPPNLRPNLDSSSSSSLPDAPSAAPGAARTPPPAPQAHKPATVEDKIFWSSWWAYHASFVADFTTTGMVIGRGGYEMDPLYTRFGSKNMAGVIGSATALHVAGSVAAVYLHDKAKEYRGVKHWALEGAALLINGYGTEAHVWGAQHNIGVLRRWNDR